MEKMDFVMLENMCQRRFLEAGSCFHVFSGENHPVLFHNRDEFKHAMNTVAFVALLFPDNHILTFEIMDNHFHFTLAGKRERIECMIRSFVAKLASEPALAESITDIKNPVFKILPVDNLENLRNVISYDNRNGAVVNPDENVFSYEWGANRFFFNREAESRHAECGHKLTCRESRLLFHSDKLLKCKDILCVDGYVSPVCYCHICEAESFFRNSRHYFYSISRNVEASKEIAKSIGESIFYTDDDLFLHIRSVCAKKYGGSPVSALTADAKMELAKELHFDFNAGNKQISRLLKINLGLLYSLFPERR